MASLVTTTVAGTVTINQGASGMGMTFTTPSTGQNSWITWKDGTTGKWELQKNTSNHFVLYNYGTSAAALTFSPDSSNATFSGALGGTTATFTGEVDLNVGLDWHDPTSSVYGRLGYGSGFVYVGALGATGILKLFAGGAAAVDILADGKVGIGTTAPEGKLNIYVGSAGSVTPYADSHLIIEANTDNSFMTFLSPAGKNQGILFGDGDANWRGQVQYNHNSDNMHFYTAAAEALRLDSSQGATFLGNATVTGTLNLTRASGDAQLFLTGSGTNNSLVDFNNATTGNLADIYANNSKQLIFRTNGATTALTLGADQAAAFTGQVRTSGQFRISADYAVQYWYKANNSTMLGYLLMRDNAANYLSTAGGQDFAIVDTTTNTRWITFQTSTKNVGIGTTAPGKKLDVAGDIRATVTGAFPSGLLVSGSHATNGPVVQVANTVTNGNAWNMISNGSGNTSGVGHLQFWNSTDSRWNLILDGDSPDAWFNGKVGIGTTVPGSKLQVTGGDISFGIGGGFKCRTCDVGSQ